MPNLFLAKNSNWSHSVDLATGISLEQTATEFYFPIGRPYTFAPKGEWLERDPQNGGGYVPGFYHLGTDILATQGTPVYAISDGEVFFVSYSDTWGEGNMAVFVKHKLANNEEFLALYGHIQSSVSIGFKVSGGVAFGKVGYYKGGDHLHFGIRPSVSMPTFVAGRIGSGMAANSEFPNTNGFADPIGWIQTKAPSCGTQTSQCLYAGFHEDSTCDKIFGWAWNKTKPNDAVNVEIFDGESKLTTLPANEFRQDLSDQGIGDGRHAFSFATPAGLKDGKDHLITVRIENSTFQLANTARRFNSSCETPISIISIDGVEQPNGTFNKYVIAGDTLRVFFSASASKIGASIIKSYRWLRHVILPDESSKGQLVTQDPTSTLPAFESYLEPGTHHVSLEVIDEVGGKNTTSITMLVSRSLAPSPQAAITLSSGSESGVNGSTLTLSVPAGGTINLNLNGSASHGGEGSAISSYEWRRNNNLISSSSSTNTGLNAGSHSIELKVTNTAGLTDRATATVIVREDTAVAPTALIAMAGGTQTGGNGSTLTYAVSPGGSVTLYFNGSGSQPGTGSVKTYEWRSNGTLMSNLSAFSFPFPVGSHTVALKITNSSGLSNTATATIVVTTATTPQITNVSPNPVTGSNSPQAFTINGSGFTSQSTVTLRDKSTGEIFANRAISSQTSTRIIINPNFTTAAHTWSVEVLNGSLSSGQFTFQVVAPPTAPTISSVSPNPVTGSNSPQAFTINGSGFTSQSTVTLRDKSTGEIFANRAISSQTSTRIIINPNFTTAAHTWSVEVLNGSLSSGQFTFQVVAPPTAPTISSVSPNPVTGSNSPQAFTINGSGFTSQSTVTLRDKSTGEVFATRAISSQTSTRIVINPNFTTAAHTWSVEVLNGSLSSGQFTFQVRAP